MKQILEYLVDLQGIDDALRDLREARTRLVGIEKENGEGLATFDRMLAAAADRIAEVRTFCREKEDEIKDAEHNLGRSRQRMNSIQSQKELTALNKELDAARKAILSRTEELGKLTEQLQVAETDHERRVRERDKVAAEMTAVEQHVRQEIATREAGVNDLSARREQIRASLPRDLFSKYERISKGRNGLAVVAVPEATCGACNMAIPPQTFIRLIRMETLEACANCSRLLVYKPASDTNDSLSE